MKRKKVQVHARCRRDYTNYLRLPEKAEGNNIEKPLAPKTRSSTCLFNWKEYCFYCGNEAREDPRHRNQKMIYKASTLPCRDKVPKVCDERIEKGEEQWTQQVKNRLLSCIDFVHTEARYLP